MGEFYNEEKIKQRETAIAGAGGTNKLATTLLIVAAVVLAGVFLWWKATHNPDTMIVDINHASKSELAYLDGVGPERAEAIIAHRPYKTPEDLKKVPGIGAKTFEKMKPRVKVVE